MLEVAFPAQQEVVVMVVLVVFVLLLLLILLVPRRTTIVRTGTRQCGLGAPASERAAAAGPPRFEADVRKTGVARALERKA